MRRTILIALVVGVSIAYPTWCVATYLRTDFIVYSQKSQVFVMPDGRRFPCNTWLRHDDVLPDGKRFTLLAESDSDYRLMVGHERDMVYLETPAGLREAVVVKTLYKSSDETSRNWCEPAAYEINRAHSPRRNPTKR